LLGRKCGRWRVEAAGGRRWSVIRSAVK